jgi:hypothetical protein
MNRKREGVSGSTEVEKTSAKHSRLRTGAMIPVMVLGLAACADLLEVDIPGNVTEDALNDPQLAETLVLSAQGDFECGFVDYMRFPGQWFEEFQNTSQSRPDALSGFRSALVAVYADPCDSGTGPIWTTMQVPRQQGQRAVALISEFDPLLVPARDFLIAKARMYEGFSIQLLGEQFCGVTFDGGALMTRVETYAQAELRFDEAITLAQASIDAGVRVTEAYAVLYGSYVGRARSQMYQGDAPGAIADATVVSNAPETDVGSFNQYLATYDANPGRRRNRIFESINAGDAMVPHRDYTDLTIDPITGYAVDFTTDTHLSGAGTPDPRVVVSVGPDPDPRGFTLHRRQLKYWGSSNSVGYAADIPFATWREARLMIAELDPAQSVAIINELRTSTRGLPPGVSASAWPLPTFLDAGLTPAQIALAVQEERRRELWMQGTQAGDKIRWGYPAWDDADEYGQALGAGGCMAVPYLEETSNTNL